MNKDKQIDLRLSSAELQLLKSRCAAYNMTVSQFLRDSIFCDCRHQDGRHIGLPIDNKVAERDQDGD